MLDVRLRHPVNERFSLVLAFATDVRRLGVYGASGSGKSSLLHCLAGMIRPRDARIQWGESVWHDSAADIRVPLHRRRIGYMTQDPLLFPHLTVEHNLRHSPAGARAGARFRDVAESLGLTTLLARMPRTLSGGEQHRVALGRALLSEPELLLLDEPFGGLDAATRRSVIALLLEVHDRFGIPWVLVSHDGSDLVTLADEVVILHDGKLVAQADPIAALAQHAQNPRAVAHGIDNVLRGAVQSAADDPKLGWLTWGGGSLLVPPPPGGARTAAYGCYANSVMLALDEPTRQSARNHFPAVIAALQPIGGECVVDLRVEDAALRALVLERTVADLQLQPGRTVWVNLKTTSFAPLT